MYIVGGSSTIGIYVKVTTKNEWISRVGYETSDKNIIKPVFAVSRSRDLTNNYCRTLYRLSLKHLNKFVF